jgi:hypothetical protein
MLNPRTVAVCLLSFALAAAVGGCDSSPPTADAIPASPTAAGNSAQPRPKLLPGAKTKVLERAGDQEFDKTFDDLRFEMQIDEPFRREMLTESINALDGRPIRIRGFILPPPQQRGIKQFVLVRDNQECCFGPGAALFDCILVDMNEGATAEYTIRPVAVSGTFDIHEVVIDGRHLAVYHIAGESVK